MSGSCQPPYGRRSNTWTQVAVASRRCPLIKIGELRVLARLGRHLERPVVLPDDDVMAKPKPRAFPRRPQSRACDLGATTILGTPSDKPVFRGTSLGDMRL